MYSTLKITHRSKKLPKRIEDTIGEYMTSSQASGKILEQLAGDSAQEEFYACYLDVHLQVIGVALINVGTTIESVVDPKSVFQHALLCNAVAIVVGHNHPSGDLNLSNPDLQMFDKLHHIGSFLNIPVHDLIAVNSRGYTSAQETRQMQREIQESK